MRLLIVLAGLLVATSAFAKTQITVAMVNNPQMITLEHMTSYFEKKHPDIQINYVTLPENELRQKATTDIATQAGQFDLITLSNYETPMWAKRGWLVPFKNLPKKYDVNDVLATMKKGLMYKNTLYGLPFYGESSMTYYRKDLFKKAGLKMPKRPKWSQIKKFAKKLNDPSNHVYGICLRGMTGWGENMAFFSTMVNAYGGRWFNMKWQPELTSKPWKKAATDYYNLLKKYGPPGVTSNGFTESETLFANGQCAMWIDATSAAGYLSDPSHSKVAKNTGYAQAPYQVTKHGANWLYSWAFVVPSSAKNQKAAMTFAEWATSKGYIDLVGQKQGWVIVPGGTRKSTYHNPHYRKVAPFADVVLHAIKTADPQHPSAKPVPYTGIQFVDIPQFQAIGTQVGQDMAAILAGRMSVDQGLSRAQSQTKRIMKRAGYYK